MKTTFRSRKWISGCPPVKPDCNSTIHKRLEGSFFVNPCKINMRKAVKSANAGHYCNPQVEAYREVPAGEKFR